MGYKRPRYRTCIMKMREIRRLGKRLTNANLDFMVRLYNVPIHKLKEWRKLDNQQLAQLIKTIKEPKHIKILGTNRGYAFAKAVKGIIRRYGKE